MIYAQNIMAGCVVYNTYDEKFTKSYKIRKREIYTQNHAYMSSKNIIDYKKV
jgi:hypothetical protein